MSSPIVMSDGTKCYSGPNCLRHGKRNLPADFSSKTTEEQLKDMEALKNPLSENTPVDIDEKIADIYEQYYTVMAPVSVMKRDLAQTEQSLARARTGSRYLTIYQRQIDMTTARIAKAQTEGEEILKEVVPYENEYRRRGGWSRGFYVNNSNGHVHKSRSCSTCIPTTRYLWLTQYSGKDESELVGDAGERACTVCFPSAPVNTLNRPANLNDPVLRASREERDTVAREKAEKAAAKAAKAISSPDGSRLYTEYTGTVNTSVSAENYASSIASDLRAHKDNVREIRNPTYIESLKTDYKVLIEALAHKNKLTFDQQEEMLAPKFNRKYKADWQ